MRELVDIKIKYFNQNCNIQKIEIGDWIDLRSSITVRLVKGEHILIPLGVAMELPYGYEAHILPRSSTFRTYGLVLINGMGVVDESYCGDSDQWYFNAFATMDTVVHEGDRIAQFRIIKKQPFITFYEVDKLNNPDRNGFGSTGIK